MRRRHSPTQGNGRNVTCWGGWLQSQQRKTNNAKPTKKERKKGTKKKKSGQWGGVYLEVAENNGQVAGADLHRRENLVGVRLALREREKEWRENERMHHRVERGRPHATHNPLPLPLLLHTNDARTHTQNTPIIRIYCICTCAMSACSRLDPRAQPGMNLLFWSSSWSDQSESPSWSLIS